MTTANERALMAELIELVKASRPRDPAMKLRKSFALAQYAEQTACPIVRIRIDARRWQNGMGNTMFTARLYVELRDGDDFFVTLKEYGYGEHYLWACREELKKRGYIESGYINHLSSWCRENKVDFDYHVDDVNRRKDLHKV